MLRFKSERRADGLLILRGFLSAAEQGEALHAVREVTAAAPLFTPVMRGGASFRFRMTNAGRYGWVSDREGYRYTTHQAARGGEAPKPWPPIPPAVEVAMTRAASESGADDFRLETCLINHYAGAGSCLGLHRDETEENLEAPIVTLTLGDSGVFQVAGLEGKGRPEGILVESGDAVVMSGPSRMYYHAFSRLLPGTSGLLKNGGRLALTGRQVK